MKKRSFWKMTAMAIMLVAPMSASAQTDYSESELSYMSDYDTNEPGTLLMNLKVGGMFWKRTDPYDEKHSSTDILAGIGMEIPISRKLNIETGLRWKYGYALLDLDNMPFAYSNDKTAEQIHWLELPVRLSYKWQLKDNLSLHLGAGPYVSMPIAYSFQGDDSFIKDEPKGKLNVGIEPAVVLYWGQFNIGAHYNIPIHKGYHDGYNNRVELTLGIRFKTKAFERFAESASRWDTDGITNALVQGAQTLNQMQSTLGGNSNGASNQYGSTSNDSGSYSSGGTLQTQYRQWAKRAESHYKSLVNLGISVKKNGQDAGGTTGQSMSSPNYTSMMRSLREAQSKMEEIRRKATKMGITIEKSVYEDIKVKY